jgi:hypothetical protein
MRFDLDQDDHEDVVTYEHREIANNEINAPKYSYQLEDSQQLAYPDAQTTMIVAKPRKSIFGYRKPRQLVDISN